jgi:hypothetical protein
MAVSFAEQLRAQQAAVSPAMHEERAQREADVLVASLKASCAWRAAVDAEASNHCVFLRDAVPLAVLERVRTALKQDGLDVVYRHANNLFIMYWDK